jgi:orotate phosphoribosyltransferase
MTLSSEKRAFIKFLLESNVLQFGQFTLKSGREAPYFCNFGKVCEGATLAKLGTFYATHIRSISKSFDVLFGPAYKGIPLAASTVIALAEQGAQEVRYSANRKEVKKHGEKSAFLGHTPQNGDRVLIIEDVITAGTTFREIVPQLNAISGVQIVGAVLAVDRCERGSTSDRSAVKEVEDEFHIPIWPIITARELILFLSEREALQYDLGAQQRQAMENYLNKYGV